MLYTKIKVVNIQSRMEDECPLLVGGDAENSESEYEDNTDGEEEQRQYEDFLDNILDKMEKLYIKKEKKEIVRLKRRLKIHRMKMDVWQSQINANLRRMKQLKQLEEDAKNKASMPRIMKKKKKKRKRKKKNKRKKVKAKAKATTTFKSGIETTWSKEILHRKIIGIPSIM